MNVRALERSMKVVEVRLPGEGRRHGRSKISGTLRGAYDEDARLPLVALGGDAPDLPPGRLEQALEALETSDAVTVPTFDGGFSCLALREPVPGLAGGFRYGSEDSL